MRNRLRASWLGVILAVTVTFAGCYPFQGNIAVLLTPVPLDPAQQAAVQEALAEAAATPTPVSEEEAAPEAAAVMATVSANALRVRQSADPDSPIVAGLRQGDTVQVVGRTEDGSWLEIQVPDMNTTGWIAAEFVTVEGDAMALPVPGGEAAAPAAGGDAAAAMPDMPAMTIDADPASLQIVDGVLTVPSITSASAGWLVVHADNGGKPGPVLGYAAVSAGENSDVAIEVDAAAATETVHLMLHEDGGVVGTYEFPGADAPVMVDGAPAMMAYQVGAPVTSEAAAAMPDMPAMTIDADPASLQIVDGVLTVPSITSASAGWLVVHADNGGKPGPVLGYAAVSAGENSDVAIEVDAAAATETVHLMLHEDSGVAGTYEFPGADAPVMVDGAPAMMAYQVGAPVTSEAAPATGGDAAAAPATGGDAAAAPATGGDAAMSAGDAAAMTGMSSSELATVNTRSLRVRATAGADGEIVGGALAGEVYPVAEKSADGKWVRIYFPGTDGEAWVGSEFVDISATELNVKYGNVLVNTDGPRLRVRNAPSSDGEVVGHVYNGDIRYAVGASKDGKWVLLFLPAMPGATWVSAEFVAYQ